MLLCQKAPRGGRLDARNGAVETPIATILPTVGSKAHEGVRPRRTAAETPQKRRGAKRKKDFFTAVQSLALGLSVSLSGAVRLTKQKTRAVRESRSQHLRARWDEHVSVNTHAARNHRLGTFGGLGSSSPPPLGALSPSPNPSDFRVVDFRVAGGAMAAAMPATLGAASPVAVGASDALAASFILWLMNCRSFPGLWYACVLSPTNANSDLDRGVMCCCCAAAADERIGETYTERGALEFPGSARRGDRKPAWLMAEVEVSRAP